MRRFLAVSGSLLAATVTACAGDSGNSPMVRFNLATHRGAAGGSALMEPVTVTDGVNTLVIEAVQMVVREIELKREDDDACDDGVVGSGSGDDGASLSDDDDGCEEFEIGPILFDLPLGPGVEQQIAVEVPAGVYDELEFEIHKPEDDGDAADREFLNQHPDFRDISIRATGTFNGTQFTFTSDLNEEQERRLVPPLTLEGTETVNLTFFVDVRTWFRGTGDLLFDPATANKGGVNENLAEENIKESIGIFEDDDRDGEDDDDDEDDDGIDQDGDGTDD